MGKNAIYAGAALTVVGLVASVISDTTSLTVYIPCLIGVILILLGIGAQAKPDLSHHFMHGAAGISLLALLGSLGSLAGRFNGDDGYIAEAAQAASVLILGGFLYLAVQSFRSAKAARLAAEADSGPTAQAA